MKRRVKIMAFLLMFLSSGALILNAQPAMKGMKRDTTMMNGMHMRMMHNQGMKQDTTMMNMMRGQGMKPDSMMMRGMHPGMGPGMMRPWMGGMGRGMMMPGMQWGMWHYPMAPWMMGHGAGMRPFGPEMGQFGPGFHNRWILDNIPDLTDKQKKDISDLRDKQQTEMKKLRDDMQAKMKALHETQKADLEKLLTPDQKKWLDEHTAKPVSPAEKQK